MEIRFNDVSSDNGVIDNFSCFFKENLISCIIGSCDSGKSTLFNIFSGVLEHSSGIISIGNVDISSGIRKKIGYMFQFYSDQFFHSSVYKEIEFRLKRFGCSNIDSRIKDSINFVGLSPDVLYLNPCILSSGEMRKVVLASLIAYDPDIFVLDDPTVGLDSSSKNDLIRLLRILKNDHGKTIIIISHDINFVHRFADYVYLLKNGRVYLEGNKYDVLSNETVMNECGLFVPDLLHFSNLVYKNKKIKIGYRDEINDLIKDVYRYAKW